MLTRRVRDDGFIVRVPPLLQWMYAQDVLAAREAIEARDGGAMLDAIALCANGRLAMPAWLAKCFTRAHDRVRLHWVRDWNAAFGDPHGGKKVNLAAARRRRRAEATLHIALTLVLRASPPNVAIDRILWERVGTLLSISGGQAEKLYQAKRKTEFAVDAESLREVHSGAGDPEPTGPEDLRKYWLL